MTLRDLFLMGGGRMRQARLQLVRQAEIVWLLMSETPGESLQRFIESGVLENVADKRMPANPLADKIAAYIEENDGKLKVDQAAFDKMLQEVTHGKP